MKEISKQLSEKARKIFSGECTFLMGAVSFPDIPPSKIPEIAIAGRSNVGKSSLVNALTNRKLLAKVSSTPGHTQQLNFFNVSDNFILCDLPGYGYAKVSKSTSLNWNKLILDYLRGRVTLNRVYMLLDCRHGVKESDEEVMKLLDNSAVSYQIVLTKADKVKAPELEEAKKQVAKFAEKHVAMHPEVIATSSETHLGIDELREAIANFVKS